MAVRCLTPSILAALGLVPGIAQAVPQSTPALAELRAQVEETLTRRPIASVAARREMCAMGISGELDSTLDQAFNSQLSAALADECLANLTRLARAGRFAAVTSNRAPAAHAVDAGFMKGFQAHSPMPADLPSMATLKPVAQRCFAQREPDTQLCVAAGFALGLRTYHGETVSVG
jgi:hypothetical protein